MPEEGVTLQPIEQLLQTDEILHLVGIFAKHGITKIRLTGGEPLLRRDIIELSNALRAIPGIEKVGITTNGIALLRKLPLLHDIDLNISLDTLQPDKFQTITRRNGFKKVMHAIEKASELGFYPLKVNCVVMRDFNETELIDFVQLTKHLAIDVRFIEWMPFDSNNWNDSKFVS